MYLDVTELSTSEANNMFLGKCIHFLLFYKVDKHKKTHQLQTIHYYNQITFKEHTLSLRKHKYLWS